MELTLGGGVSNGCERWLQTFDLIWHLNSRTRPCHTQPTTRPSWAPRGSPLCWIQDQLWWKDLKTEKAADVLFVLAARVCVCFFRIWHTGQSTLPTTPFPLTSHTHPHTWIHGLWYDLVFLAHAKETTHTHMYPQTHTFKLDGNFFFFNLNSCVASQSCFWFLSGIKYFFPF